MIFVVALILIVNVKQEICLRTSGVYRDNEFDQTEIDWSMTRREKQEMELEILNLLGLPNRPRRINGTQIRRAAPQFLLDIYKSLVHEEEGNARIKRDIDLDLDDEEKNAIDESDVIMTIESVNHHVSGVRHERGKRIWFNVSDLPLAENIIGAELRIYKKEIKKKKVSRDFTVTAYQLVNINNGERELEFISAINTTDVFSGWLSLNLTSCLSSWVVFPDSNKGLYLSVHFVDKPGHELRPEDIGLVTVKGEEESHPFMVAFLKGSAQVKPRKRRDVDQKPRSRIKKSDYSSVIKNAGGNVVHETSKSCKIRTLYVSFKDINWMDWIIAPEGYDGNYCAGDCNFPLNAHMNATNHAIVQTLVHLMIPTKFPKPCCAPTKLAPISVLYFVDDYNVILRKFKKMVVKSCGCH